MYFDKHEIETKSGTLFLNNTRKYLAPTLLAYGDEFMNHVRNTYIISTSIQDYGINVKEETRRLDPHIYILFDVNGQMKFGHYLDVYSSRIRFQDALAFFQLHPAFVYDYPFDSTRDGNRHVIVLKLPQPEKFERFMAGEYSKMYTKEEMKRHILKFSSPEHEKKAEVTESWAVLAHDGSYFPKFKQRVFEDFGTYIEDDGREYDYPIQLRKEILRYDTPLQQQI